MVFLRLIIESEALTLLKEKFLNIVSFEVNID